MNEIFKRVFMEILIITLLEQEDRYGYSLVKELERYNRGRFEIHGGDVYSLLYRMYRNDYVSKQRVPVSGKRVHISYRLEPAGQTYARRLRDGYIEITKDIRDFLLEYDILPTGQHCGQP